MHKKNLINKYINKTQIVKQISSSHNNYTNSRVCKMARWLLTSKSDIKTKVVKNRLKESSIVLDCRNTNTDSIYYFPKQPIGVGGLICCKNRILSALKDPRTSLRYNAIISIEYSLDSHEDKGYWEEVYVMIYSTKTHKYYYNHGCPVFFDQMYWILMIEMSFGESPDPCSDYIMDEDDWDYTIDEDEDWAHTVGEAMKKSYTSSGVTNPENWMSELPCVQRKECVDRHNQINQVFSECFGFFRMSEIGENDVFIL